MTALHEVDPGSLNSEAESIEEHGVTRMNSPDEARWSPFLGSWNWMALLLNADEVSSRFQISSVLRTESQLRLTIGLSW